MAAGPVPGHHPPGPTARAEAFRSRMLTKRAHGPVTTTHRNWMTGSGEGLRTSLGAHRRQRTGNTDTVDHVPSAGCRGTLSGR